MSIDTVPYRLEREMPDFEYWMGYALKLADQASDADEVPIGAIVVKDGQLIGRGFNQTISRQDPTAHAEIIALRQAAQFVKNHRLVDTDLYVTIEPCSMCAGALVQARITRLIYGAKEPRSGAVDSSIQVLANPALNHKIKVVRGILEVQAAEKMQVFFRARRN
ncbi:MAG: tRNA adenosine(34) deaminase TadA [Pseudomonadales bacterium]|nr:tRNA adenosine(34) deaminase TadA [Pseudomonadales bacterium]